jgi:hypothetical protein
MTGVDCDCDFCSRVVVEETFSQNLDKLAEFLEKSNGFTKIWESFAIFTNM